MRKAPPKRLRKPNGEWRDWSQEEIRRLKKMRADGCTSAAIATELGRTVGAVNQKIKKFRLTKSRMPRGVRLTRKDHSEIAREDAMQREQAAASQDRFSRAMQDAGHGSLYRGPDPAKAVRSGPQHRG